MEAALSEALFEDARPSVAPWSGEPFKVVIADPPRQYRELPKQENLTG